MTTFGTFDIDTVPAPSDYELAPITVIVAPPAPPCTCDHGNVKAPNGTWEFCIKCVPGIELELKRISRNLCGIAERMEVIRGRQAAGLAQPWELAEYGACDHSRVFLNTVHDRLEIKQAALKARL